VLQRIRAETWARTGGPTIERSERRDLDHAQLTKDWGAAEEKPPGPAQKKPARGACHYRLRAGTLAALFVEILHPGIDGGRRARQSLADLLGG
jgi:hypothetical protein